MARESDNPHMDHILNNMDDDSVPYKLSPSPTRAPRPVTSACEPHRTLDQLVLYCQLSGEPHATCQYIGNEGAFFWHSPAPAVSTTIYSGSLAELKARLFNQLVEEGAEFRKCANCSNVYPLSEEWNDQTVCGELCHARYVAYLNDPDTL